MDSTEKYLEISEKLRNLEPVKASDDFMYRLNSKIIEFEAQERTEHSKKFDEVRGGFLRNLFGERQYPWLIPAVGFTILIFFVFYIIYQNKNAVDNNKEPLLTNQQEQAGQKNQLQQNQIPETEAPSPVKTDNPLIEKEKSASKNIAGDLHLNENKKQPSKTENKIQLPDNDGMKINTQELNSSEKGKTNPGITNPSDKKDVSGYENKPDTYNEGRASEQPMSNQSTSERVTDIPKAMAVKENSGTENQLGKHNTIDKSNLENLRNKISDN